MNHKKDEKSMKLKRKKNKNRKNKEIETGKRKLCW